MPARQHTGITDSISFKSTAAHNFADNRRHHAVSNLSVCDLWLRLWTVRIVSRLPQPKCIQTDTEALSAATAAAAAIHIRLEAVHRHPKPAEGFIAGRILQLQLRNRERNFSLRKRISSSRTSGSNGSGAGKIFVPRARRHPHHHRVHGRRERLPRAGRTHSYATPNPGSDQKSARGESTRTR